MVKRARLFRRSEEGATLVEGLIVFPIILLTFATFIEFGVAVVQWNQTVKAMQYGARFLAVSDPLVSLGPFETYTSPAPEVGDPVPQDGLQISCGAGAAACNTDGINRLVFGSSTDLTCDPSAGNRLGMCDLNGLIRPENIRVTYYRSGLGYVGRPGGPVVSITVETRDLNFNFFFLGALLGLNNITIPAHPVTITSEDLSNTI
ncbi:TadE/TadG family type IV pilus assembly protein [Seohaeicola saemankumensis]|uniref:TadE/TadG family type IV pilus assembly protein n=1 Tax=Seohaeicola saemankumensis TaxID=481181 RepID=A0ABW3TFU5_9RHOB